MMQETMIYSVKTALMGMMIVFFFLSFLSVLMWGIKGFFSLEFRFFHDIKNGKKPVSKNDLEKIKEPSGSRAGDGEAPQWLYTAATLYLLLEEEEREGECTAGPWCPSPTERMEHPQLWILSGGYEK